MLLTDAREFPAKVPRQACSTQSLRLRIDVFLGDFIERHDSSHRGHKVPPVMPIIVAIKLLRALRREVPMQKPASFNLDSVMTKLSPTKGPSD